jgi:selenocysteine lyase/cysteine desulfurase
LGLEAAVRVSLCHYNTLDEIRTLLAALKDIAE